MTAARQGGPWRWWRAAVGTLIALLFVAGVQRFIGWPELLRPWRELPVVIVALPALALLASHGLRALRVHDHFGGAVHGRRRACLQLVLRHNLLNNLLPMRAGELAFPVLMARRFAVPAGVSVPGLLWFRLLDLHSLGLFALPVLAPVAPIPGLLTAGLAWLALPWLLFRHGRPLARAAIGRAPPRLRSLLEQGLAGVPVEPGRFWRVWSWTLANWALKLAAMAWALLLFVPVAAGTAVFGAIGGELTSVLPVHGVAGLGTYEAGVVAALAPSGVEPVALVRVAVNLHLLVLGVAVAAGAVAWLPLRRPLRDENAE